MGTIQTPSPVKLICGVLFAGRVCLDLVEQALVSLFGQIDVRSQTWPFDYTSYYDQETGPHIGRVFLAFRELADPGTLADVKVRTNALERELAERVGSAVPRPVNLDPGYIDSAKLVLATTKDYGHRVYVGQGIYAEVTLCFRKGSFEPWPWTYPDYRSESYRRFFMQVRQRYLEQRRGDG